jgi:dephospho-CoA kinase
MLRVGLTGGLGSGKSTAAEILREHGIQVLEADEIAREMMQPGQEVYRRIVEQFGESVVRRTDGTLDGTLDRSRLARLAFEEKRLGELNRIVHPPVVAEQERRMEAIFAADPEAVAVVESALIFEAEAWGTIPGWRRRFDRVVLVTAPDEVKIRRYLGRVVPAEASAERRERAERDARARLAAQLPDAVKAERSDYVVENTGPVEALRKQVDELAERLRAESRERAREGTAR